MFLIQKFISENNFDDTVSSYSEIDEDLLEKFGYQKARQKVIAPSPVSNHDTMLIVVWKIQILFLI